MASFETYQDSLKPTKRPKFNFHSLPDLQEGPRLARQPGSNCGLDCSDFRIIDGQGISANSDNSEYSRGHKYREAIQQIEATKQVTGE